MPTDTCRVQGIGRLIVAVALMVLIIAPSAGQDSTAVSSEMVQARISELEASAGEPGAEAALTAYRQALASLQERERYLARARELETAGIEAPRLQAELQERLAAAAQLETPPALTGSETAAEVEKQLAVARAELLAAEQTLEVLTAQAGELRGRPAAVEQRLARASEESRSLQAGLGAETRSATDSRGEAAEVAARARLAALAAEIRMLEQELLTQPARLGFLAAQRDEAAVRLQRARQRVDDLQSALAELREMQAARTLADSGASGLRSMTDSEAVEAAISRNAELAAELASLATETRQSAEARRAAQQQLESLRRRFESAREKLEVAGLSPALGRFLQAERGDLPQTGEFTQASRLREARIAAAGLRGLQLDEALKAWRPASRQVDVLLASVAPDRADALRAEIEALVQTRSELLEQLLATNSDYLRTLSELEATERQSLHVVRDYREFLSRNLLWTRNKTPLGPTKLMNLPEELGSILKSAAWLEALRVLWINSTISPLQMAAWLLVFLATWKRHLLLDRLRETAKTVGKPSADTMGSTLKALGLTIALAAPWPLFVLITGHQLGHGPAATPESDVFGDALVMVTPILFFLIGLRNLCLPGGVAEAHFQWMPAGLVALRRELLLLGLTLLLPGIFLIVSVRFAEPDHTFGFVQLIYLLLVFGVSRFLFRLLRPGGSIVEQIKRRPAASSAPRWCAQWLVVALAMPVLMGGAAISGFMYSASLLLDRVLQTMLFGLALVLARELAARWLLVLKRRVLLREALARRAAAREMAGAEGSAGGGDAGTAFEPGEDVASLDSDSRKLVNVILAVAGLLGIATIWSPVFPALATLTDISLWEYAQEVSGEQVLRRVSLADLLLALLLSALTIAASRSLPALVEILLRQRGSVPSGSRLAFATLARYGIVLVGLGVVLSIIGINWSKLQWLVAALGVGIGFGLQEIVANFISGLIILIERPVRVGDVVTVGDASGKVIRIKIRATTIRNWDEQEMVVPNKEFITTRVINWSLSDEVSRIFFQVGVAYGSDVERALRLIEESAVENPVVLEDPAPLVTFESFGDNTLNLGLRCYVPTVGDRLKTITALHVAINRKLSDAGIVIAFPQRDVHLDTSSPLEIRLLGGKAQPAGD